MIGKNPVNQESQELMSTVGGTLGFELNQNRYLNGHETCLTNCLT